MYRRTPFSHPCEFIGNRKPAVTFGLCQTEDAMQIIDNKTINGNRTKPILNVAEFCRRYRLDKAEETRLRKLFGEFASRHELLMNAQRKPSFR
ncbi:hypothetical protein EXN68_19895 [Rhizobium rhizogenes]|uniref:Uncharacterized protein n=1 Tax=Rhizobium rhizogenes TaxID=359 RepID=A0A546XCL6_RHIRH|nr:hypothetical protein EXN68_19895 [Rhizobium rhizogenes]